MDSFHQGPRRNRKEEQGLQTYQENEGDEVASIWLWMFILILTAIPIVNVLSLVTLAFFVRNKNLQNYGKASLLIIVVPTTFFWLLHYFSW